MVMVYVMGFMSLKMGVPFHLFVNTEPFETAMSFDVQITAFASFAFVNARRLEESVLLCPV